MKELIGLAVDMDTNLQLIACVVKIMICNKQNLNNITGSIH